MNSEEIKDKALKDALHENRILRRALMLSCEEVKKQHPIITSLGYNLEKHYFDRAEREIAVIDLMSENEEE